MPCANLRLPIPQKLALALAAIVGCAAGATSQELAAPGWQAQIVDANGAASAQREFLVHTFGADGSSHDLQRLATDEEGHVRVELDATWRDRTIAAAFVKSLDLSVAGWLTIGGAGQGEPRRIPVAPPIALVQGQVTGFRPIPDDLPFDALDSIPDRQVTLWPEYRLPGADDGRWRWIDGGAGVDRVPSRDGGYEIRGPSMRMSWRADGSFDARGWPPPGPMRLQVRSRWHLPAEPVAFDVGDTLEIEVRKGGAVRAVIALPRFEGDDPLRPHRWLVPRIVHTDPAVSLHDPDLANDDPAGDRGLPRSTEPDRKEGFMRYDWPSLPAGSYRLEVTPWGGVAPVVLIDDITVVEPYLADDPRLDLDLRATLRLIPITVRAEGEGIDPRDLHGFAVRSDEAPGAPLPAFRIEAGRAHVLAKGKVDEFVVHVAGFLPATARDLEGATTIDLRPGPAVAVSLDRPRSLPADAILEAVLTPASPGPVAQRARLPLAAGGGPPEPLSVVLAIGDLEGARGHVGVAGSYRLHLRLKDARYGDWIDLEGTESRIEVPAGGMAEPVAISLPEEPLQDAIRRMRLD